MSAYAIGWAKQPAGKDYTAAYDLLVLAWGDERAERAVERLRAAPTIDLIAADVAQAAGFDPLPLHDAGVRRELRKVAAGRPRRPILCLRAENGLVIADGHHRLSLSYQIDPFAPVRAQLA